jgi:hypothetical protein
MNDRAFIVVEWKIDLKKPLSGKKQFGSHCRTLPDYKNFSSYQNLSFNFKILLLLY